jgi:hypothetical protein
VIRRSFFPNDPTLHLDVTTSPLWDSLPQLLWLIPNVDRHRQGSVGTEVIVVVTIPYDRKSKRSSIEQLRSDPEASKVHLSPQ